MPSQYEKKSSKSKILKKHGLSLAKQDDSEHQGL